MPSGSPAPTCEHFVTLFDNNFLPMGLCLHRSLCEQALPFHLWILCLDDVLERNLKALSLPNVSLIPLREAEHARLLEVKPSRSRGEYCWTLTPFAPQFVFDRDPNIVRVTYLDADLFFFDDPRELLAEFAESGRHVLITEHAYDPRYDKTRRSGRFCVQFVTFRRTAEAESVMHWWQDRCLEWCYARVEAGKFGDQKYLDEWPERFGDAVHILRQKERTLAPWNASYFEREQGGHLAPVFYHFHSLRLIRPGTILLYSGYDIGTAARALYQIYQTHLSEALARLRAGQIPIPYLPLPRDLRSRLRHLKRGLTGGNGYAPLPVGAPQPMGRAGG